MCNRSQDKCTSPTQDGGNDLLAINFLHFILNLILAGFVLRFLQVKMAGTDIGKALSFVY